MTKIMLVEDDNNLREIYEARLAAEGYTIVSAQDGEAALAMAGKERPDLIISDVMMPKISGFEMLDILRNTENLKDVKVIMLTALGQSEDSQRANSLGANRYLVKSQVTLEDIVKATHDLLNPEPDNTAVSTAPPPASGAVSIPEPDTTPAPAEPFVIPVPSISVSSDPTTPQVTPISVAEPPTDDSTTVATTPEPTSKPTPLDIVEPEPVEVEQETPAELEPASASAPAEAGPPENSSLGSSEQQVVDAVPDGIAQEEAAIRSQIDSFVASSDNTPDEVSTKPEVSDATPPITEPEAEPAEEPVPEPAELPEEHQSTPSEKYVEEALGELISDTEPTEPAEPPTSHEDAKPVQPIQEPDADTPAPSEDMPSDIPYNPVPPSEVPVNNHHETSPIAGKKKIISPLHVSLQPDINQLLDLEEAKNAAQQAAAPPQPVVMPSAQQNKPVADGDQTTIDPNSIAL